jgi:hypothetical protein
MNKINVETLKKAAPEFLYIQKMVKCVAEAAGYVWANFHILNNKLIFRIQKIGGGEKFCFSIFLKFDYKYLKYLYSAFINGSSNLNSSGTQPYLYLLYRYNSTGHTPSTLQGGF